MPPRKRARTSTASTPLRETQPKTPAAERGDDEKDAAVHDADPTTDPWTDEQETQLLRGLMKWKPTGVHKHFHMTRLAPSIHADTAYPSLAHALAANPHTRVEGIWRKLDSLYNLEGLDEKEDATQLPWFDPEVWAEGNGTPGRQRGEGEEDEDDEDEEDDEQESWSRVREFTLDESEFGDLIWAKRFAGAGDAGSESQSRRGRRAAPSTLGTESPPFFGWESQRTMPSQLDASTQSVTETQEEDTFPKKASASTKGAAASRSKRGGRGAKAESEEAEEVEEEGEDDAEEESEEEDEEADQESSPEKKPVKRGRGRPSLNARRSVRKR